MNKIYCDKCGKEIKYSIGQLLFFPMYQIRYIKPGGWEGHIQTADLCKECQEKLAEWINNWPSFSRIEN